MAYKKQIKQKGLHMRQSLEVEKDTLSIMFLLREVSPRDFDETEEIMYDFANFMHSYARFLDVEIEPTPDQEAQFTAQLQKLKNSLSSSTNTVDSLVGSGRVPG